MITPPLRRNLFDQQAHNKRLTLIVMCLFVLFLTFLGLGFDLYITGSLNQNGFVPIGSLAAVALGVGSSLWSLRGGSSAVLRSTGAAPLDGSNQTHKQLSNVVDEMAIASGLPRPQVFVIPDDDPNAFATGKDPRHSAVAVTQGLLDILNREELQGVVAHEMSHIRNYDIRLMTVVAALMGSVLLLSDWARRAMWHGGKSRRRTRSSGRAGALLFVLWLAGIILAPVLAQIMAMAVSRKREFLADASAAELTRNPLGLASALRKLESASAPTASIKRGAAHLCIVDPTGRKLNSKEGFVAELFGTHPPLEQRITALQAMAYQHATTPTPSA